MNVDDRRRDIAQAIQRTRERIDAALYRSGRTEGEAVLVVVTKTFPAVDVRAALDSGVIDVGENRVQEGSAKRAELNLERDAPVRWHLIGPLQSNKVRRALESFDVIQTVDSGALGERIDRIAGELDREPVSVLVQVHLGEEESKSGVRPENAPQLAVALSRLSRLRVEGLMAVPPPAADPDAIRPWVRELRKLRDRCRQKLDSEAAERFRHLSIGMSHDFEAAIEEGATIVRVGSAIFGSRV